MSFGDAKNALNIQVCFSNLKSEHRSFTLKTDDLPWAKFSLFGDEVCFICCLPVIRVAVLVGIDRNGWDSQFTGRTANTDADFTAISYEDLITVSKLA